MQTSNTINKIINTVNDNAIRVSCLIPSSLASLFV